MLYFLEYRYIVDDILAGFYNNSDKSTNGSVEISQSINIFGAVQCAHPEQSSNDQLERESYGGLNLSG